MNDKRNKGCGCAGGGPVARIVKGNDFTVVALASVYDGEKGLYVPFSLAEAADVELNIVGVYGKVPGKDVTVDGNSVSARFSGAVGIGRYGVEILFRDSEGKGRVFELGLFEVVRSSGEASSETGSEGETGEGYNISVDVRARTVRIGKSTGVTDYSLLDNKPSIGGVTLEGDKSLEDLGYESPVFVVTIDFENPNEDGSYNVTHTPAEIHEAYIAGKIVVLDVPGANFRGYLQGSTESASLFRCDYTVNSGETDEPYSSWLWYNGSGFKDFGEIYTAFSFNEQKKLRNIEAQAQVNTIEHILIGDKEYEPKTVGTKKKTVCLPDNPYELRQGEGHDGAYYLLRLFLVSAYQASAAGLTTKNIELSSDQQDALDDLMNLPSLIHYPDQSNEGLFYCFGDPANRVTIICIPGAYVSGKMQHNLSVIAIEIDRGAYVKIILNTLSTLTKNGDGTKYLNDKGEYADPVAGVKSSVEALAPYDCTEIVTAGLETTISYDKGEELKKAIEDGRPLFATEQISVTTESRAYVGCVHTDKTGIQISLCSLAHYQVPNMEPGAAPSDEQSLMCMMIGRSGSQSSWTLKYRNTFLLSQFQKKLISGTTIKTVNGQSLLGTGDITLAIPTKVSELSNDAGYLKADTLETITDASEVSVTCEAGRIRQGNNITTLSVGCSATDNSQPVEERIIFSTGPSVESITVTGVSWANGDTPSFKADKVYEISVTYIPLLGKFLAAYAEY